MNERPVTIFRLTPISSLAALLTIFQKVCDAVAFAHARGVIHRDLKPANIMVGDYGEVLLMDWGLAKVIGGTCSGASQTSDADDGRAEARPSEPPIATARDDQHENFATLDGAVMGTPQYMSPEQARGEVATLDQRSDLFSLGTILYELVTLSLPFPGKTTREILANIKSGQFLPPNARLRLGGAMHPRHLPGAAIPDSLEAVISKALAHDRKGRYQRVAELQSDLAAYQNGFATRAENAGLWRKFKLFVARHKGLSRAIAASFIVITIVYLNERIKFAFEHGHVEVEQRRVATEQRRANLALAGVTREQMIVQARQGRADAEAARKEADELISAMQDNLLNTLAGLGSRELMDEIDTRIIRYHSDYPSVGNNNSSQREEAATFQRQGDLLLGQGDLPGALHRYRDCLALVDKQADGNPADSGAQRDLALIQEKIGDSLKAQGDWAGALQSYREALAVRQTFFQRAPDNVFWQSELALDHEKIGDVLMAAKDLSPALESYRQCLDIRMALAGKNPGVGLWQHIAALSHAKVGSALLARYKLDDALGKSHELPAMLELDDALRNYRTCLAYCERLSESDPSSVAWQLDLAVSYENLGDALRWKGQFAEALNSLMKYRDIIDRLGQNAPNNYRLQIDRANARLALSLWARDNSHGLNAVKGGPDEAVLLREAIGILRALEKSPGLQQKNATQLKYCETRLKELEGKAN